MADGVIPELRLRQDVYHDQGYSSVEHLADGLMQKSTLLSPLVTHLFYSDSKYGSKNFPLMFYSEGQKNRRGVDTIEYRGFVMGKPKKTSVVAKTINSGSDTPGKGFSTFKISFKDRWFHKSMVIMSSDHRYQARVISDPKPDGDEWIYTVRLVTPNKAAYCPIKFLAAGQVWSQMIAKVGTYSSEGVEHRSQSPGEVKNQVSIVRDSYRLKGNIQNKIMVMEIKGDAGVKKYWCEWELYLKTLMWKEKCETDLWYSIYNRADDGEIYDTDEDGQSPVPQGAGLVQQIPNEDYYAFLTEDKLIQIIRDAMYNAADSYDKTIRVHTGIGGRTEVDRAMKNASKTFTLVDSKVVQGEGRNMTYGAYFTKYQHIDGQEIEFVYSNIFDEGPKARSSELHPETGLPLESYSLYFIDYSMYDGKSNLEYIYENGRGDSSFLVAGAMIPPGYKQTQFRATGRDESAIHWIKSQGLHIHRPTNCFKVFCNLS